MGRLIKKERRIKHSDHVRCAQRGLTAFCSTPSLFKIEIAFYDCCHEKGKEMLGAEVHQDSFDPGFLQKSTLQETLYGPCLFSRTKINLCK